MHVADSTGRVWNFYPTINVQGNGQEPDKSTLNIQIKMDAYVGKEPVDMADIHAKCVAFVRTL